MAGTHSVMSHGDSTFTRVYDEQVRHVYAYFAYRVRDPHLAEDLTQTTFERALRHWPRFDPAKASARTWLLTIAHNLLVDHYRSDRSDPVGDVDETLLPIVPGPEDWFSAHAELAIALEHLSDREREILALRFGGDLSGPEIAEMLGLSLANVQQLMSRSLRKLRLLMEAADTEV